MDFITGRSAARRVTLAGPLPPARVFKIAQQLLSGLAHAARREGIIHRDLKPRELDPERRGGTSTSTSASSTSAWPSGLRDGPAMTAGLAVGTPSYMSPGTVGGRGLPSTRGPTSTQRRRAAVRDPGRAQAVRCQENVGELIFRCTGSMQPPRGCARWHRPPATRRRWRRCWPGRWRSRPDDPLPDGGGSSPRRWSRRPRRKETRVHKPALAAPAPAKTTVDTVSAVRRRLGEVRDPPLRPPPRRAPAAAVHPIGRHVATAFAPGLVDHGRLRAGHPDRPVGRTGPAAAGGGRRHPPGQCPAARDLRFRRGAGPRGGAPSHRARAKTPRPPRRARREDPRIEQARQLVAAGQSAQATELLKAVRAEKPDDADVPLSAGIHLLRSAPLGRGTGRRRGGRPQEPRLPDRR